MNREIKEIVGTTELEVNRKLIKDKYTINLIINQALSTKSCHVIELSEHEASRIISALIYLGSY